MTVHSAAERGGDKRERILVAAERVFARCGFFAARVSEIAKEAGVADGTIYLYFKSKDDLLISLFERRMTQMNEALRQALAEVVDGRGASRDADRGDADRGPTAQLHAFIHTYLSLVASVPAAAEVLTIELRQSSK